MGYGGTKTEMERLIADANAVKVANGEMGDLSISKFADVVEAIHIVQTEMGITGTTAKEANETISGSFGSMKAAWENFLTSLADGNQDTGEAFEELWATAETFFGNLIPKIGEVFDSIGPIGQAVVVVTGAIVALTAATKIYHTLSTAFTIASKAATAAQWLFNAALNANPIVLIVTLISGLVAAIIGLWNTNEDFRNALISAWEWIADVASDIWEGVASFFTETIPNAFNDMVDWFKSIPSKLYQIGADIVNGIWDGIVSVWNDLVDWFSNAWDDLVGGVKDFLGIASPSKVFAEIGGYMAEGVGVGWDDEFGHIEKDINHSMEFEPSDLGVSSFNGENGSGFGSSNSFGDIYITVDGANVQNETELAEALAERLQFMTERSAMAYA